MRKVRWAVRQLRWAAFCAAGIYRREGWEVPLGAALLELRECASRLKLQEVCYHPPAPQGLMSRLVLGEHILCHFESS